MPPTTITRATWTDDDGSGTTGTILNNARLQGDVYDKVDGLFSAAAGLNSAGPLVERGRATPLGEWITIPYSAGIFTAAGSMTWTVEAADVTTLAYTIIGKTAILTFNIGATALAGTASGEIYITLPAALTASITTFGFGGRYSPPPSGTWAALTMYVTAATAKLAMQPFAGGAFTLSAASGAFQGSLIFGIA